MRRRCSTRWTGLRATARTGRIFTGYTTSNAVHQCSKLPRTAWDGYLDWLFDLEYQKIGIPKPDAVFYLEVDPQVSQRLLSGRYGGDETKKDIHERDLVYLEHSRAAAAYCADRLGWRRIACCAGGAASAGGCAASPD